MEATISSVFLVALITALVTGLGAVPFLFGAISAAGGSALPTEPRQG